jgi:predicted RNA binding protein YcfA (HicA-like mRNA interferase family)
MAPKPPLISGSEAVKAFKKAGWTFVRQKGAHAMLTKSGMKQTLSVPQHKELARGTLAALIKDAGLTVKDFEQLL